MDIMERALERRPWLTPLILGVLCVIVLGPWLQLPTDRVLGNGDMISWFFPYVSHIADSIRAGGLPLWNPCQFSGYSNVANPQLGLFYPITWLILVLPANVVLALSITVHLWLAGVGMAVLLHSFGATRSGALLSGVVLVFSEYMAARIYCWSLHVVAGFVLAALGAGGLSLGDAAGDFWSGRPGRCGHRGRADAAPVHGGTGPGIRKLGSGREGSPAVCGQYYVHLPGQRDGVPVVGC
jgi:hypothetical protein